MALLHRLFVTGLLAATLIGCSGEAEVETGDDATGDTAGAARGESPASQPSTPAGGTDSAGRPVGGVQPTMERPVLSTEEQNRIDAWLTAYADSLNDYGDPKGTMYAGGTPLFNEAQGKPVSKYEYIAAKHPEKPWNQPLPTNRPKPAVETKTSSDSADDKE